jgi:hypothetical protein
LFLTIRQRVANIPCVPKYNQLTEISGVTQVRVTYFDASTADPADYLLVAGINHIAEAMSTIPPPTCEE